MVFTVRTWDIPPNGFEELVTKGDWLTRKEAALYLTANGHPITHKTLANLAVQGSERKGPAFKKICDKGVMYHKADLEKWAAAREREVI